jgi:hypothetical protein
MMIGWRTRNLGISIAQGVNTLGEPYITLNREGKGLSETSFLTVAPQFNYPGFDIKEHLAYAAGLKYEPLRSYTPKQLYELMLRNRSPLLVEAHWDSYWTHAYVVKRIYGSGEPWDTVIIYNEPNDGEGSMGFKDFMEQLEGAANQTTIQVMHY